MSLLNRKIKESEKAAVYYHVFAGVNDWRILYAIADGITDETAINRINASSIYKWKSSAKIVDLIREATHKRDDIRTDAAKVERERMEGETGGNEHQKNESRRQKDGFIDYSLPENQSRKLNELINQSGDNGEVLDALKVIIQTQKADRDAAKAGKAVNAYVPITCNDCPLYIKARKK